jgi:S1-C subfamily serine protease
MRTRAVPAERSAAGALAFGFALVVAASAVGTLATKASGAAAPGDVKKSFDAVCERARPTVVTVVGLRGHAGLRVDPDGKPRPARTLASGVIIDDKSHVLTTASAVRDCDAVRVRLSDGRTVEAVLIGRDDASDVALLELPLHSLPHARLADDGTTTLGDWVCAVGRAAADQPPTSLGTVRRRYDQPLGSLLLVSNEVYPGYGGGALFNAKGEMAGLIIGRAEVSPEDWPEAPGPGDAASFAIASEDLRTLVDHLERYGRVQRGFLGVRMAQGEVVDSQHPDDPFKIGVRVQEVLPGSPAHRVGLQPGDLIVGWNGETLSSPEDLMRRVEACVPGTTARLVWVRSDDRHDGTIVIDAKPDDDLLASPGAPALRPNDPSDAARSQKELMDRVQQLRSKASADSSTRRPPG